MPNQPKVLYRSTLDPSYIVDRRTAVMESQPPGGGLYVPTFIPKFHPGELESLKGKGVSDIGYAVMEKYLKGSIPDDKIREICESSFNYDMPIEQIYDNLFMESLDQGPTAAFKDTGARSLASEVQYYVIDDGNTYWLLTATSGDTGAAVANAFHGLEGINVIIGYPKKGVTEMQAALMNTYGDNIIAIEYDGEFNDIQDSFIKAFSDKDISEKMNLFSANSINIGRAQPQAIHAVYAVSDERVASEGDVSLAVPSGNFGHAYSFILAKAMGAFDGDIIIGNNSNNLFHWFMKTGEYRVARNAIKTSSNAMDVRNPSNLRRVFDHYGGRLVNYEVIRDGKKITESRVEKMPDMELMKESLWSTWVDEPTTKATIRRINDRYGIKPDPHGSVGVTAAERYRSRKGNGTIVSMKTAHPGKFPKVFRELGIDIDMPDCISEALKKDKYVTTLPDGKYETFKDFLMSGEAENIVREQKSSL